MKLQTKILDEYVRRILANGTWHAPKACASWPKGINLRHVRNGSEEHMIAVIPHITATKDRTARSSVWGHTEKAAVKSSMPSWSNPQWIRQRCCSQPRLEQQDTHSPHCAEHKEAESFRLRIRARPHCPLVLPFPESLTSHRTREGIKRCINSNEGPTLFLLLIELRILL